ncbi:MAG: alpha/beta hydrolase family protein [Porticoccaceae bacterium]
MNKKNVPQGEIGSALLALTNNRFLSWLPGAGLLGEYLQWPDEIPRPEISLSNLVKVGVDEGLLTVLGSALTRPRLPTPGMRQRAREELEETLSIFNANGWIDNPETYHRQPPELTKTKFKRETSWGIRYEHMTFESDFEPRLGEPGRFRWLGYEPNHTAHAWVLRHAGTPRPWMICIHGYRMGSPWMDLPAFRAERLHRQRGINVLNYVLPLHGPHKIGARSGDGLLQAGYVNFIHAEAQAIWDLRRILDWLKKDQQAPAVGAYGLSLGGFTTALFAGLAPGLACAIAGVPPADITRASRRLGGRGLLYFLEMKGMPWGDAERASRVVSPLAFSPKLAKERRYIFAGLLDRLAVPREPYDLWEHWERPTIDWYPGNHVTFPIESSVQSLVDDAIKTWLSITPKAKRVAVSNGSKRASG